MTCVSCVDGWRVVYGMTATLPDGTTVADCTWHARHAYLDVPGHGIAERVTFDPDGQTVNVVELIPRTRFAIVGPDHWHLARGTS
jgi:hypothetical protein